MRSYVTFMSHIILVAHVQALFSAVLCKIILILSVTYVYQECRNIQLVLLLLSFV